MHGYSTVGTEFYKYNILHWCILWQVKAVISNTVATQKNFPFIQVFIKRMFQALSSQQQARHLRDPVS